MLRELSKSNLFHKQFLLCKTEINILRGALCTSQNWFNVQDSSLTMLRQERSLHMGSLLTPSPSATYVDYHGLARTYEH